MRVAHWDCFSGISGDMVLGAVIDAGVPVTALHEVLASLNLPIRLEVEAIKRSGIACRKATIIAEDEENYRYLPDVEAIIARGALTGKQRDLALTIVRKLAAAEAKVHGMPIEKVHFHEVGALDSIADIVLAAFGLDQLGVERFTASSVPTGSGQVACAHGLMPVPAPATLELLKGIPLARSNVKTELTTPTGAAILASVVTEFTDTPAMTVETVGIGSGTKDLIEQPNILRLLVGTSSATRSSSPETDEVVLLETNLDDCSGEMIGFAMDQLLAAGALDVFAVPIQMKKSRPGVLLSVITRPEKISVCEQILFQETGTFGIRRQTIARSILQRERVEVDTPWGKVGAKRGWRSGVQILSPEFEDCARVASNHGVALRDVYDAVRKHRRGS